MSTVLDPDWDDEDPFELFLEDTFDKDDIENLLREVESVRKDRSNEVLYS